MCYPLNSKQATFYSTCNRFFLLGVLLTCNFVNLFYGISSPGHFHHPIFPSIFAFLRFSSIFINFHVLYPYITADRMHSLYTLIILARYSVFKDLPSYCYILIYFNFLGFLLMSLPVVSICIPGFTPAFHLFLLKHAFQVRKCQMV